MINKAIARRYAYAIFEIASEKNRAEKFAQDLKTIINQIDNNPAIKKFIYGRLVPAKAKKEFISKIAPREIDQMVLNFIYLVMDKSREQYLTGIVDAFDQLAAEEKRIVPAQVQTAIPLTEGQIDQLEKQLSKKIGQSVKAKITVEPSLIGGMAVRIGDIVYDGSIVKKLDMLKEHLQKGTVSKIGVRQ